ncbi:hypothetical protein EP47_01960 [Legionella norrlandica]|uniref:Uncharacterized protein n=1 Tax=Legionella norrlandica TaxID=1498499 RepID=A0A0A2SRQ7_9GAMM|nr:hypothetical protein [Legionella norrlandica]KGP62144.1 hypothetical protein EP47_01960 [Legionella norrlandica]
MSLPQLMTELKENKNLKLLVLDFDETINHSSGTTAGIQGEFVHPKIGTHLQNILSNPNIRVLVVSKGTDNDLAHQLLANQNLDKLLVVSASEVYHYLEEKEIKQEDPIRGTVQKSDLIQSIRCGIMNEIDDLDDKSPTKRIIGWCDDSEAPILECVSAENEEENKYNFPVVLVPHEKNQVCRTIDYFAIIEFLAQYHDQDEVTKPVKKALNQALQEYKKAKSKLDDYTLNSGENYSRKDWEALRDAMQTPYREALTKITKQIENIKYEQEKIKLGTFNTSDPELKKRIQKLIKHIDYLKNDGANVEKLTSVIQSTNRFLNKEIDPKAYKELADSLKDKPSKGMKILGAS